ncbi:hypothetical protein, partial [Dulcicalothrix desertica]
MESKTKSVVISEAARIIATHHPNQESYLKRWEIWKTTFDWICKDIPENQADRAAKVIVGHVKNICNRSGGAPAFVDKREFGATIFREQLG